MYWSAPYVAATAISVWMHVWITVSRLGQKHLLNAKLNTLQAVQHIDFLSHITFCLSGSSGASTAIFPSSQVPQGLSVTCAPSCGSGCNSTLTAWFKCASFPTFTPFPCAGTWAAKPAMCWGASTAAPRPLTACSGRMATLKQHFSRKFLIFSMTRVCFGPMCFLKLSRLSIFPPTQLHSVQHLPNHCRYRHLYHLLHHQFQRLVRPYCLHLHGLVPQWVVTIDIQNFINLFHHVKWSE